MILFDIDYTLLDTDKLRRRIQNLRLPKLFGMSAVDLEAITAEYTASLKSSIEFSPRVYVRFLTSKLELDKAEQKAALAIFLNNPTDFRVALYPEVISTLEKLREKHSLGIFSEGDLEFQKAKLEKSGIKKFFVPDLIFIFPDKNDKLKVVQKKTKDFQGLIFIVDDNVEHVAAIAKTDFIPILVDRKGVEEGSFTSISNLSELEKTIGQIIKS